VRLFRKPGGAIRSRTTQQLAWRKKGALPNSDYFRCYQRRDDERLHMVITVCLIQNSNYELPGPFIEATDYLDLLELNAAKIHATLFSLSPFFPHHSLPLCTAWSNS